MARAMTADRPMLGISLVLVFCVLAPLSDSFAKLLGDGVPLIELLAVRFAAQALLLVPVVWLTRRSLSVTPRVMKLTAARTAFHIVGSGIFFLALRYLPIADVVAITFVMPLIMLLLGHYVLAEEVGMRRLVACCIGFVGTLLVVQPSFVSVGWPAFLPLLAAVVFALYQMIGRQIAKDADPLSLQTISGFMATPILIAITLATLNHDSSILGWKTPGMHDAMLLAAVCVTGTLAHLILTWAFRYAPSATLAPMQYLEIPFATLIGWLIFSDLPNGLAALGIAITIASGLYIVFLERAAAQPAVAET
jgi:drug/metabolite transporter (DMT)-like permease